MTEVEDELAEAAPRHTNRRGGGGRSSGGRTSPVRRGAGRPSFRQLLEGIDRAWREQRGELEEAGRRLVTQLAEGASDAVGAAPTAELLDTAVGLLEQSFDPANGGWGGAPKFPQPMTIEFLLRRAAAGDARALPLARRTLDRMADGGVHDQLGGGVHRD